MNYEMSESVYGLTRRVEVLGKISVENGLNYYLAVDYTGQYHAISRLKGYEREIHSIGYFVSSRSLSMVLEDLNPCAARIQTHVDKAFIQCVLDEL